MFCIFPINRIITLHYLDLACRIRFHQHLSMEMRLCHATHSNTFSFFSFEQFYSFSLKMFYEYVSYGLTGYSNLAWFRGKVNHGRRSMHPKCNAVISDNWESLIFKSKYLRSAVFDGFFFTSNVTPKQNNLVNWLKTKYYDDLIELIPI